MIKSVTKKKTIYDIADEAGVSTATVSRVLNNSPKVDYNTRLRITQLLDKYHYKPKLIKNRTANIGIIIDANWQSNILLSPYIIGITEGIIEYTYQNNLESSIIPFEQSKIPYPEEMVAFLMERNITGAIFINPPVDAPYIYSLEEINYPYVAIGSHFSRNSINSIDINNSQGIELAIDYLYDLGHRKIGFINVHQNSYAFTERDSIYRQTLLSKDLALNENYILLDKSNKLDHKRAGFEVILKNIPSMSDLPTAFLCLNDEVAIGAMKAFKILEMDVPNNISIIGFDDYSNSEYYTPTLTTIHNPIKEMGYTAAENIERWIKGKKQKVQKLFEATLIVRESCKNII